jgi:signal transduction histidine kinase
MTSTTATGQARSVGRRLRRGLLFTAGMCTTIALLLTALGGGSLVNKLIYSFCIGGTCWLLTDGARQLLNWGFERAGRAEPLARPGWRTLLPQMLLGVLLSPWIGLTLGDLITGLTSPSLLQFGSPSTQVTLMVTVLGTVAAFAMLSTLERLASARAQAEAAQRLAAENELRLLQSQLEPHMLFNTLANLRVLIALDPPRAQAMLDRLIAFLRATLTASRQQAHPLAAEFDRVADYLALMTVRMGARLQSTLDLPDALRTLPVPPLLLQPLVENCIKHGLEPQVEGGRIEVRARRDGAMLVLTVRDTGLGLDAPAADGTRFGLQQVRDRLRSLYGTGAGLTLQAAADADGGTLATIQLPLPP